LMDKLLNIQRREAMRAMSQIAMTRIGIVTSYDPDNYAAKVLLQPEGYETGFLPIATPWAGGQWGMFCPPTAGGVVDVHFQEGGKQAGFIALRHYGDEFRPLPVPSGEFWLVHKSGSSLKFLNDGTIAMNAQTSVNVTAPEFNLEGDMNVTGIITAGGDIIDRGNAAGSVQAIRAAFDVHVHSGVQGGSGDTGVPTVPL